MDVALTIASFIPVPGIQQVAWLGKAASIGIRIARLASKSEKLLSEVKKAQAIAKGIHNVEAEGRWSHRAIKQAAKKLTGSRKLEDLGVR